MDTRADRFPLFDSLRAIAALMVVCSHIGSFGGVLHEGDALRPWVGQFAVAVPIFLLISGFLLYRPFAAARLRGRNMPSIPAYGWRRVLRIVPAYWVAVTIIAIWLGSNYLFHGGEQPIEVFSATGVAAYYGFGQLYSASTRGGGIPQAWTIDTEVAFYIALPLYTLLAFWLLRRYRMSWRGELLLLGGIVLLSQLYKLFVVEADDMTTVPVTPLPFLSSLPAYADHFALGMGLGVASVAVSQMNVVPRAVSLVERRPWVPWLVSAIALWAVSTQIGMEGSPVEQMTTEQYFARHALFGVIAFGLLLPAVFGDHKSGWVRRLLGNRALLHFGMVSYGVYLWHLAWIIQLVHWDLGDHEVVGPWFTWLPLVIGGAWILGSLSYYLVERPALAQKRLVPDRRPAPSPEPAP
jgi:peptidoglycan/LPS O-acetylase OafA/YrhL